MCSYIGTSKSLGVPIGMYADDERAPASSYHVSDDI